jgi:hypothetical protein
LVQFSKFGKNSVKVPPILCEAETTSTSTAVPHGLMVEFIARPAPPKPGMFDLMFAFQKT